MFPTGSQNRHTVQHFSHVHPLTEANGIGEFTCDGCKTYGSGKSFRCGGCNYDLHDYCATCPQTLRTFMHPHNELRLLWRRPDLTCQSPCTCNVCGEAVEGLYYRCNDCDFDVHPLCTLLPQHVRDTRHPKHPLELSHRGGSTCMVCHGTCHSWRYRCVTCGFDVHMECVSAAPARDMSETTTTTKQVRERGLGQRPAQPYPYPYHYQYYHHRPQVYGYNYGYHYGPMNPGYGPSNGLANGLNQKLSIGKKMFGILWALTLGVACNVIAAGL